MAGKFAIADLKYLPARTAHLEQDGGVRTRTHPVFRSSIATDFADLAVSEIIVCVASINEAPARSHASANATLVSPPWTLAPSTAPPT